MGNSRRQGLAAGAEDAGAAEGAGAGAAGVGAASVAGEGEAAGEETAHTSAVLKRLFFQTQLKVMRPRGPTFRTKPESHSVYFPWDLWTAHHAVPTVAATRRTTCSRCCS